MLVAVEKSLHLLHEFVGTPEFSDQVASAKDEYFKLVGAPLPGEPLEELRLASFTEWFIFDRRLDGLGRTPAEEYLKRNPGLDASLAEVMTGFTRTVHSVFQIKQAFFGAPYLQDLYTNFKYKDVQRVPITLSPGDMADLRIAPVGEQWFATDATCFHPYGARKQIAKIMKEARKTGKPIDEVLFGLLSMNTRYERYPKTVKGKAYAGG